MKRTALTVAGVALLALSVHHFGQGLIASARYGFVDFPIFLRSTASYLETGQLYLETDRLSVYAPAAPVYKFPPLFAMTLLPFADVEPPGLVYDGFWLLQIAIYLGAVTLALTLLPTKSRSAFVLIGAITALNFEPFFETLWRLQLETPILLLLIGCLCCLVRGRDEPAGALLGVAAMLKVYPAFLLVYFVAARRWRALLWTLATAALIQVALLIVIGPQENQRFFVEVLPLLLREHPLPTSENVAIARYAMTLFQLDAVTAKRIGQLAALILLASSLYAIETDRRRYGGECDVGLGFSLLVPVMLLVSPNSWVNYQLLLLAPVLLLLSRGTDAGRRWRGGAVILLALAPLLFYAPCADASVGWPCAQTPEFLGLGAVPRGFHDAMVSLRGLPSIAIWGFACHALLTRRRHSSPAHR